MNDNDDTLPTPTIGRLVAAIESLNMRLHVAERALVGLSAFATPEQRHAVARLVDQAGNSYKPVMDEWPQMGRELRRQMDQVIASYKATFSA